MDNLEKKLWAKTNRYCKFLKCIPFLRFVGVCNSLAFSKVTDDSDIDLFIIAKANRLFIVRTLVTFYFHILGVRRHGNKVAGRFCLSFFVDDENMDFSKIALERDIYLAYWIYSMKAVLDDGVFGSFIEENLWIRNYFNDGDFPTVAKGSSSRLMGFVESLLNCTVAPVFEWGLRKWQLLRARKKMLDAKEASGLIVSKGMLKFHNCDRRRYYRDLWDRKFSRDERISTEKFLSL